MATARARRYDVFVSYSHRDRGWVKRSLLPRLSEAGLRVCIDESDFVPGVASVHNMESAVQNSRHTLIVLTPDWVESEWTAFEGLLARGQDPSGRRRTIIPLMLKRCEPPGHIALSTYIDISATRTRSLGIQQAISQIKVAPRSAKRAKGSIADTERRYFEAVSSKLGSMNFRISRDQVYRGRTVRITAKGNLIFGVDTLFFFATFDTYSADTVVRFFADCYDHAKDFRPLIALKNLFCIPVAVVRYVDTDTLYRIRTDAPSGNFFRGIDLYPIVYDISANELYQPDHFRKLGPYKAPLVFERDKIERVIVR